MTKTRQVEFGKVGKLFTPPAADVKAVDKRFFRAGHGVWHGARHPLNAVHHVSSSHAVKLKGANRRIEAAAVASGRDGDPV